MSDKPTDAGQTGTQVSTPDAHSTTKSRKALPLKSAVAILVLVGLLFTAYKMNWLPTRLPIGKAASHFKLGPLFTRVSADRLFSSDQVLEAVGGSPTAPPKALVPAFDRPSGAAGSLQNAADKVKTEESSVPEIEEKTSLLSAVDLQSPPRYAGNIPTVETRIPPAFEQSDAESRDKVPEEAESQDSEMDKIASESEPLRPEAPAQRFLERNQPAPASDGAQHKEASIGTPPAKPEESAVVQNTERTDQYQVPGSLLVKIHNYTGTPQKWGLMVIVDDSVSMGRKTKIWNPDRLATAADIIGKLPGSVTSGSKIAVRDFLCNKAEAATAKSKKPCLSHKLYDWHDAPFADLKTTLKELTPAGITNPFAAAAFSLSKDFPLQGGLIPRILVITDGAGKCSLKDLFTAIDAHGGKDRVKVDVIAMGMHRKRQAAYTRPARSGHGLFYTIDGPRNVDTVLERYGKALKTPVMETIEVRGDKATLTISPDQEIAVIPGVYTVQLPAVAGILPSRRTIEGITIRSGETTSIDIKVKKGRPVAKIGKK